MKIRSLLTLGLALALSTAGAFDGRPRPDWIGKPVKEAQLQHAEKPTIYVFAQPDCASCSLQLNALAALQRQHEKLDVVLVTQQNSAALREYLAGFTLKPRLVFDPAGDSVVKLGVRTIPALMFVDAKGKVQGLYEGVLSTQETKQLGAALAQAKQVPQLTVPGGIGSQAAALPGVNWASHRNHLLIFHQLTCRYCIEELPHLVQYAKSNPQLAVWIIAPNELEAVKKQFAEAGAPDNIRIVEDSNDKDAAVWLFSAYRAAGTPTQILVSDKGAIRWRSAGFSQEANPFEGGRIPLE